MIYHYYVIGNANGFRRDGDSAYQTVPWPSQADRFYSRKLAERRCRGEAKGEFVLGPYTYDDGGPKHLVHAGACPQCGAVPIKEEAQHEEDTYISG